MTQTYKVKRSPEMMRAVIKIGGLRATARLIGCTPGYVIQWRDVPAVWVPTVAKAAGLKWRDVRPDLTRGEIMARIEREQNYARPLYGKLGGGWVGLIERRYTPVP